MRADIQLALELVRATQTDLTRFPKRLRVRRFRRSAVAGFYNWITDTLHLSERYLGELDDDQAADLLDTIIHELLHVNTPLFKQMRDTFLPHPDIYAEAARRTASLRSRFRVMREQPSAPRQQLVV
jgi:hypothetical protein